MAGGKSTYADNHTLDAWLGATTLGPATTYLGLYTTNPSAGGGGGVEVTGGSYARVSVTNNSTNWPAASSGSKSNGTVIAFPTATANWGTVTGFGIFDALTTGNLLYWGPLNASVVVNNGNQIQFNANGLTVTEA